MNEVARARAKKVGVTAKSDNRVEVVIEHEGVLAQLADIKARKAAREAKRVEVDTSAW